MKGEKIISQVMVNFFGTPLDSIHIEKDIVGHVSKIIFCREDNRCLCVSNDMVDLSGRLEEGCLQVDLCNKPCYGSDSQKITIDSGKKIIQESLKFLFYERNGNFEPSGFLF